MCSLAKNFHGFHYLIQSANIDFDVIAVSEARIVKNKQSIVDRNLLEYSYEFDPTESLAGGT